MRFGPTPLDEAEGAILAHSVPLPGGGRLRKGKRLDARDIAALRALGHDPVTAARLDPTDHDEDSAALALARALAPEGSGLSLHAVGTGRVNIHATGPGLARIDAARIDATNATDDAITVATVPEWHRMEPGAMVATVKIIAYGVRDPALTRACAHAQAALSLARPVLTHAALIETSIGAAPGPKGARVTAQRLDRLGVALSAEPACAHSETALAAALAAIPQDRDLILILTASATSDLHDTAPEALRRAGGTVTHFGMPVDPGNLLFLGQLGSRPVIGLPGCARSPALNGADWVLERVICGHPPDAAAIRRMGVGGLLKDIPTRPRPRTRTD
ncbi:MAG: molybdopterin-binding protein [Pararhodobacter sp.]